VLTPAPGRRPLDQYFTPAGFTRVLLDRVPEIQGHHWILEPCSGQRDIADILDARLGRQTMTNDLDIRMPAAYHLDATKRETWDLWSTGFMADWVITNPPFNAAHQIVPQAVKFARVGVAMLLRLSWLEPTADREDFLSGYPPSQMIVLPRYSYTGNGKTDSVTSAWMIWHKQTPDDDGGISVATRLQCGLPPRGRRA
jgi:hypothetical protein